MNKKGFLIITVILFMIIISMAGYGIYEDKYGVKNIIGEENPLHEFKYNGKLYFYGENGKLLGKYICQNPDTCDYAILSVDDNTKGLNYYKSSSNIKSSIINNQHIFIEDEGIYLYDLKNSSVIANYSLVKNYGVGIENNKYIVCNEACGVIKLDNTYEQEIPFEYDYIGLLNNIDTNSNKIIANRYVVIQNNIWSIIDSNNKLISKSFSEAISSYSGKYIITQVNDYYKVYDYEGNTILDNEMFKYLSFTENYLNIINQNNELYVYDIENDINVSPKIVIEGTDYEKLFTSTITQNNLELIIYTSGEVTTYTYDLQEF